jgi:hypothetical protein
MTHLAPISRTGPLKLIHLFGLRRTGTNLTKYLLETNFDCLVTQNTVGSKHDPPVELMTSLLSDFSLAGAVYLRKPLLPWLASMRRYNSRHHPNRDWSTRRAISLARIWVAKNLDFSECERISVERGEAVLGFWVDEIALNPAEALEMMHNHLPITAASDQRVLSCETAMRPSGENQHAEQIPTSEPFDWSTYRRGAWSSELAENDAREARQAAENTFRMVGGKSRFAMRMDFD